MAWATKSMSAKGIAAMIQLAQSLPGIVIHHARLDADPWLLNVDNGAIDLRTGCLRDHDRNDLCTKLAPVAYDPDASCPTWDAFLSRAMGGNSELVAYLQSLIGYSLTGVVREHVLAFFFGAGANGKSTFLSTIHAMLGDYASPAPRQLLFRTKGGEHPTGIASLYGKRFVTCSEIEEGLAFDEALVKDLTGGDPIEARRMREDFWTFLPSHTLIMAGNHKPTVRGDDEGIWRRMRLVPWTVTIPEAERDPELPEKLKAELPGILAWAVRGCLGWQKANGLKQPEAVREATTEYRKESDALGQFLALHVRFDPEGRCVRKELRERYEEWCKESGYEPLGAKRFTSRVKQDGGSRTSVKTVMGPRDGWKGVRFSTDTEKETVMSWGNGGVVSSDQVVGSTAIGASCARDWDPTAHRSLEPTTHYEPKPSAVSDNDARDTEFADWVDREVGPVGTG